MGTLGGLISHSAVWTGTHALGQTDRSYADGFVRLSVGVLLGRFGNKLKVALIAYFPCQHAHQGHSKTTCFGMGLG